MPEVKYSRDTNRFNCLGLDLNRPVDSTKPSRYPYLKNVRSRVAGRIDARDGLTDLGEVVAGQLGVHSIRRLNDDVNSTYALVIGTGTHLAYGQSAAFTDLDSGYSGDPLALVPFRPQASPSSYMYVADRLRMRKITAQGALDTLGYAAPNAAPAVALTNAPLYKVIDEFDATTGWAQAGTAGAPSLLSAGPGYRTTGTISQILYDSGTTGWACVNLSAMAGVGYGERLNFNPGGGADEIATVQAVFPASVATTISRIIYDAGTDGPASLVLATPIAQVAVDALIRNSTAAANSRIIGVTRGPNGDTSLRVSTAATWSAGETVQILASFRVYLVNNHAAAETVRTDGVRTSVTVGTGSLTKTAALDLSLFSTGNPSHDEDYMTISLRVDRPDLVTEIKVLLDVDSTTNDCTRNFYSRTFRASDLTPSVRNLQPLTATRTSVIQNELVDSPIAPEPSGVIDQVPAYVTTPSDDSSAVSQQFESGDVQWVPLRFRLSDLVRVGTDDTRSRANVAIIRILVITIGTVVLDIDSWWIGGGYGPDTGNSTAIPLLYRYRVRNPATNVPSNFSPATRLEVSPLRQSVTITPTQYTAPSGTNITATNLVLDLERFGGEIADWHYIGTVPNSATPSYTDVLDDLTVGGNPILDNSNYQPWPILGVPVSGTAMLVVGTSMTDSGTSFNTSWAMGTRILINSVPFTIYRVISTSLLELVENAGYQASVTWRIDEPTILAQPLPCLWEWDNVFFACGDPINPGRLYYSNPGSETTREINYMDLTSPSEPLMNGVQFNIRSYVWSSENFIQLLNTGDPLRPYRHENIPNGKGLFSRWAATLGPAPILAFLGRDGIYATLGSSPISLTDADLYPIFPSEGNIGVDTNGVYAPTITSAAATRLRLQYYDEYLYFDYAEATTSGYTTLAMNFDLGAFSRGEAPGGWFWDSYNPNVIMHYGEEGAGVHRLLVGTTDARLYQYTGNSDNGTPISCEISTPSLDQGDPRANKLYGDVMLDTDTNDEDVTATVYYNNNVSNSTAVVFNTSPRALTTIPLGSAWVTARNISLNLIFNGTHKPKFYIWEPRWTFESAPIAALSWEISPTTFGMEDFKHIGLCRVTHVSTTDLLLTFTVDGVAQAPITITASGGVYKQTIFRVPVMKGKLYKLRVSGVDTTLDFRLDTRDTFIEVKPWGFDGQYQQLRVFGDYAMIEG